MNRVTVRDRVWGNKAAYDQICSEVSFTVRHRFDDSDAWRLIWTLVNQIHERIAESVRVAEPARRER